MAETADALDADDITGPRAAVTQRVEGRDPWRTSAARPLPAATRRDMRERLDWRNHVSGVAAVITDPGNLQKSAIDEIAAPARLASKSSFHHAIRRRLDPRLSNPTHRRRPLRSQPAISCPGDRG